jgi:hypothetical protein
MHGSNLTLLNNPSAVIVDNNGYVRKYWARPFLESILLWFTYLKKVAMSQISKSDC